MSQAPVISARRILHCDMDCFYAAVHMRDDAALRARPVVVGGDPARRGVVASASYEARRFGIRSAMPTSRAVRLCPAVTVVAPDFPRYRRESERIFAVFGAYTPLVQTVALDEAYLDVTDHLGRLGTATAIAEEIRARVRAETGLTVSVGVGPNKLVAKIASDHKKPDGLTVVPPQRVEAFLAGLPVRALPGVGPSTEAALSGAQIRTIADLRRRTLDELIARFRWHGRTLYEYARGIDTRPVAPYRERKSLSSEETYDRDLTSLVAVDAALVGLAAEVSVGLERRDLAACTITIKVRYGDFTTVTRSRTLREPIASAPALGRLVRELVRRTDAGRRPVRLLGVGAATLVSGGWRQLDLFDGAEGGDESLPSAVQ